MLATNAIATGAADYVVVHRALHNPPRPLPREPDDDTRPGRCSGPFRRGSRARSRRSRCPTTSTRSATAPSVRRWRTWWSRHGATVRASRGRSGTTSPSRSRTTSRRACMADPICIFDCDIPVDGVAAFVFATAERAQDLPHKPVYVSGYAQGHPHRAPAPVALAARRHHGRRGSRRVPGSGRTRACRVRDIDVPQIYDGFSPFVYFWLESLGYCGRGRSPRLGAGRRHDAARETGSRFCRAAARSAMGRMHGVPQMLECYLQLSQRAGERQLPSANVGLACHSSPHFGGAVLYSGQPL